jgi:hypothetical protein
MESEYENRMTKEELLTSVGASNPTSAPKDVIDSITKGTIPDATPIGEEPPTAEEKKVTAGEIFQPSEQLMEWLTTTGERKAQPIRNPASAFFNINSIDRYASAEYPTAQFALLTQPTARLAANPAFSYNMNLGRNLMSGYFHRLTITDVNIQWNIPTINIQNYLFTFFMNNAQTGDEGFFVVRLPYGYYTFEELASQMQSSIKAVVVGTLYDIPDLTVNWTDGGGGSGAGFTFQSNNPDITIALSTAFPSGYTGTPSIQFPLEGSIQTGTSLTQAKRAMYKFYLMIGATSAVLDTTSIVLVTAPSYPTLIYTSYVDVISNKLSQFMRVKDSETSWSPDTSVITRIYLTNQGTITAPTVQYTDIAGDVPLQTIGFQEFAVGSRPFILNYTPNTPKNIKWSPDQAVVDFDIRVVDEFGDQVPWDLAIPYPVGNFTSLSQQFFEFQLTVLCSET